MKVQQEVVAFADRTLRKVVDRKGSDQLACFALSEQKASHQEASEVEFAMSRQKVMSDLDRDNQVEGCALEA